MHALTHHVPAVIVDVYSSGLRAFKVLEIPDESDEFALAEAVSHVEKLKQQEKLLLGAINSQKKLKLTPAATHR